MTEKTPKQSDRYIPITTADPNDVMASLRKKVTEAHKETRQLQEQLKEKDQLISELVEALESYYHPEHDRNFESLIKKATNPEKE